MYHSSNTQWNATLFYYILCKTILIPSKRHLVKWDSAAVWFLNASNVHVVLFSEVVLCCGLLQAEDGGHEEQLVSFDKYVSVPVYELPALSKSIRAENILCVCVQ